MDNLPLNWIESLGYLAFALVFLTFWMRTLIALRIFAIASNLVFIIYAFAADLTPILVLHAVLLPVNVFRVGQHIAAYRHLRATADGRAEVAALVPFMTKQKFVSGAVLFLRGDRADRIFFLNAGSVDIPEIGKTLSAGTLFGEVGLFTPDRERTASAVCAEDCELLVMSDSDIVRHCLNDPAFGLFLTKLIAGRMAENQKRAATPFQ